MLEKEGGFTFFTEPWLPKTNSSDPNSSASYYVVVNYL